jgi:hypothetical protein
LGATVGLTIAMPAAALAQEAPDGYEAPLDPLVPTGLALSLAGIGGATIGVGFLVGDGSDGIGQACDVTGPCVEYERSRLGSDRLVGVSLVSGGLGMAAVGLPSLVAGLLTGPEPRDVGADSFLMTGTWLTGVAAAGLGAGIGALASASDYEDDVRGGAVAVTVVGGVTAAVGLPLVFYGASRRSQPAAPSSYRSEGRVYAGMSLATLGALGAGSAIMLCGWSGQLSGDFAGLAVAFTCFPPLGVAVAGLGAGIPLWATGAREDVEAPSLSIGAGSMALEWRY